MIHKNGNRSVGVRLFVQVENVRDLVFLQHGIAAVHLANKFVKFRDGVVLVINDAALQMWQALEGEVIHAEFRIDEDDLRLFGCVRAGDPKNDVLHEHGFAAAGRAGDERVRGVRLRRQKQGLLSSSLTRDQQTDGCRANNRDSTLSRLQADAESRRFGRAMAMATMPGSARTEITFSPCVVRNSERRFSTCSTVRFALP